MQQAGRAAGEAAGEAKGLRRSILTVMRARFGAVPATVEERVAALGDEENLERLLERASTVATLAER